MSMCCKKHTRSCHLCKRYVQYLLNRSAQGHFCRLPVVQVTIPPNNNGFIGWEICFLRTRHCSTWVDTLTVKTVQHGVLKIHTHTHTVQPGYNDIGLYDTPSIPSDILCYQSIPLLTIKLYHSVRTPVYNDTKYSAPSMTSQPSSTVHRIKILCIRQRLVFGAPFLES